VETAVVAEDEGVVGVGTAGDAHVTLAVPETVAVERTELPNGLVVCSEFVPGVRSIALGAWVRSASVHERREQMGVSHLLEHLVFKGTQKRSAHDIALALESRGGSIDAYTGREHTAFQAHFLDRDLPVAVDLIRDLIFTPLLNDADLQLERQVVYDEIALVHDTPDDVVFEEHNAALWGEHPYGYSILGTRESLGALSEESIRALHGDVYRPGNVVVAAAGNVQHDQLITVMKESGWHDVPAGGRAEPVRPNPIPSPASRTHVSRDSQQAHVVFGSTTIRMADASRPAYLVVSALLGGGMSSRLFQRVREQMGLAYSVYGFHSFHSDVGVHGVYVGTGPDTAERAVDAVSDELRRLVDDGIREDELETGRQQLIGQFILSQESVGARMQRVAGRELYAEPYRTVDEIIQRIESVTPADALQVAQQWFTPERQTVVVLGPA
jgi:predicted Zn-dependent peptidase